MSFDTLDENRRFAENNEFPFPLLCDTTRQMGMAYGAAAPGSTSNASRIGVIVDPDGKVKAWFSKVSPGAFPAEALEIVRG